MASTVRLLLASLARCCFARRLSSVCHNGGMLARRCDAHIAGAFLQHGLGRLRSAPDAEAERAPARHCSLERHCTRRFSSCSESLACFGVVVEVAAVFFNCGFATGVELAAAAAAAGWRAAARALASSSARPCRYNKRLKTAIKRRTGTCNSAFFSFFCLRFTSCCCS